MSKPLHLDERLTPIQRSYVLGFLPEKVGPKFNFIGIALTALLLWSGLMLVGNAVDRELVPEWAVNVSRFAAGFYVVFLLLVTVMNAVNTGNITDLMSKATVRLEDILAKKGIDLKQWRLWEEKYPDKHREFLAKFQADVQKAVTDLRAVIDKGMPKTRPTVVGKVISIANKVFMFILGVGLVMNGFFWMAIFLAVSYFFAWGSGLAERDNQVKAIQFLFPDQPTIIVEHGRPDDTGVSLAHYTPPV